MPLLNMIISLLCPLNTMIASHRLSRLMKKKQLRVSYSKRIALFPLFPFPHTLNFCYNTSSGLILNDLLQFGATLPSWVPMHNKASITGFSVHHPFLWLVQDAALAGDCLFIHLFRNICWATVVGQALL